MTVVQLEIYRYCRMLGLGENVALKTAAALHSRGDLAKIRRRGRFLLWAFGAAILLTGAAQMFA